ncbi:MAG: glycosyltransferase family 4 protein [Phreatobacter sp.]|jgi:glycosyltransferase involved in cell wall biosynthesis|uniref:glycosyltransferase family 4 protein n=1 Tax=Phreatobacter sp. TaxID=1966341 RepID=UPI004036636F
MSIRVLLWYWGRRGGGALFTKLLARHLREAHPQFDLYASLSSGNDLIDEIAPWVSDMDVVQSVGGDNAGLVDAMRAIPRWRGSFAEALERRRPDIVVAPMMFAGLGSAVDLVAKGKARLAYVVHDPVPHQGDRWGTAQRLMQNRVLARSHRVIAMSHAMAETLARRKRLAPIVSAQPLEGHYLSEFAPLPARKPDGTTRFLSLGRLVDYKGFDRIAGALRQLPADAPVRLTIIGDGPAAEQVRATFSDDPRVTIDLRWTDTSARRAALAAHDALLCPYTDATQSGIVCEALTAGRLTVVTPKGALPEQVGEGAAGRVVDDLSPGALARALLTPLPPPDAVAAACRAQLVEAHGLLSWGTVLEDLAAER